MKIAVNAQRWLVLIALCFAVFFAKAETLVFYIKQEVLLSIEADYGSEAKARALAWQALVQTDASDTSMSEGEKLARANDFFNQVRWLSDIAHWGEEDYWATPLETLASNAGDCEDFSIGKYFSLENVALPTEKLRITYVKALNYNQAHMVLAYYPEPNAEPLILDNINKTILPASARTDLFPIYSFDAKSIWLSRNRGKKLNSDSKNSLPKWRGVNERLGFELRPASG